MSHKSTPKTSARLQSLSDALSMLQLKYMNQFAAFQSALDLLSGWAADRQIFLNRAAVKFGNDEDDLTLVLGGQEEGLLNLVTRHIEFAQHIDAHFGVPAYFLSSLRCIGDDPFNFVGIDDNGWFVNIPLNAANPHFPPREFWQELELLTQQIADTKQDECLKEKVRQARRAFKELKRSSRVLERATA